MIEIVTSPEVVNTISLGLLALWMAFTARQKEHIKDRDNNLCQFPEKHKCNGSPSIPEKKRKLQVHHIIPQRYAEELGIDPDFEENGITLCSNIHISKEGIHTDIVNAHTKEEFAEAFAKRDKQLKERKIYWNAKWDRLLHTVAVKNTQRFKTKGRIFPLK